MASLSVRKSSLGKLLGLIYSWSVPVLSDCLSRLIPWNKNLPALIQSHPGWDGGGDGLGGSWEASGSFPSPAEWDLSGAEGAQSSTGSAGAAVGLQVGMLVWSSPVAAVSIASGSSEPWQVLPKLRHPRKSVGKGRAPVQALLPFSSWQAWAASDPNGISWLDSQG